EARCPRTVMESACWRLSSSSHVLGCLIFPGLSCSFVPVRCRPLGLASPRRPQGTGHRIHYRPFANIYRCALIVGLMASLAAFASVDSHLCPSPLLPVFLLSRTISMMHSVGDLTRSCWLNDPVNHFRAVGRLLDG